MKELLNKHNQRSCPMKKSIQTVPYNTHSNPWNLKKFLAGVMLVAVPVFTSCEKDPVKPNDNDNNNNPQPQKHNVELVYGEGSTPWQNVALDTLYKYNFDPTVDTIFMVPYQSNMLSTASTTGLKNVVGKLRERHNVNPQKIFGKGDLELKAESVQNNQEIVRFFADTLKYNVVYHNVSKHK